MEQHSRTYETFTATSAIAPGDTYTLAKTGNQIIFKVKGTGANTLSLAFDSGDTFELEQGESVVIDDFYFNTFTVIATSGTPVWKAWVGEIE
jgi:hypothetical protein